MLNHLQVHFIHILHLYKKLLGIQGLKLLIEQVVCHNVSAETLYLPSDDTNTAMNNDESSHVSKHVGFAKESVPIPQQVVPQPIDSGSPPSSSNERNMKSHDDPPKCECNTVKIASFISPVSPVTLTYFKLILSYLYLPKSFIIFVQV